MLNYKIISSESDITDIKKLSKDAFNFELSKSRSSYTNYEVDNWESKGNTFLHLLKIKKRFDFPNGICHVLYNDKDPIGFCGGYKYNNEIFIGLVRAYIDYEYRNKFYFSKIIVPSQIKYAKYFGCKKYWLTFNDYNQHLYKLYIRKIQSNKTNEVNKLGKYNILKDKQYVQHTWQNVIEMEL